LSDYKKYKNSSFGIKTEQLKILLNLFKPGEKLISYHKKNKIIIIIIIQYITREIKLTLLFLLQLFVDFFASFSQNSQRKADEDHLEGLRSLIECPQSNGMVP